MFTSILIAFWKDFVLLIFLNIVTTVLSLSGPFLIKKLIDLIKTGKNAWEIEWEPISSLPQETEYGLLLVAILVMTQGVSYFVSEHITYKQNMVGTLSSSALVALIYEKTLRISAATNHKFKSGDLLTFIQVDVQKLNFLCY